MYYDPLPPATPSPFETNWPEPQASSSSDYFNTHPGYYANWSSSPPLPHLVQAEGTFDYPLDSHTILAQHTSTYYTPSYAHAYRPSSLTMMYPRQDLQITPITSPAIIPPTFQVPTAEFQPYYQGR